MFKIKSLELTDFAAVPRRSTSMVADHTTVSCQAYPAGIYAPTRGGGGKKGCRTRVVLYRQSTMHEVVLVINTIRNATEL